MSAAAPHFATMPLNLGAPSRSVLAGVAHAPEVRICRSCRGKGMDRYGFDCVPCLGSGEVDE